MSTDVRYTVVSAFEGCYEAQRAAALSGVPVSTVYDWARNGIIVPSLSEIRPKRWSYADLMALRIVYWLRHPKNDQEFRYPASPMLEVKRALVQLQELGLDIWSKASGPGRSSMLVDRTGHIVVQTPDLTMASHGQTQLDILDLLGPFEADLTQGPDLIRPRPHLRIVPGKVSGEPHLEHSRLTTLTIAALAARGYDAATIGELYPDEQAEAIVEAIELERTLAPNTRPA
jgi:uncharacterized protein (DUF433 family)